MKGSGTKARSHDRLLERTRERKKGEAVFVREMKVFVFPIKGVSVYKSTTLVSVYFLEALPSGSS